MLDTSRALLSGIIDYAGLFPPAKLPMDEAFRRFLGHRSGNDGWLLARFVCPAARLDELAPMIGNTAPEQEPIRIAALGSGGEDPPRFAEAMDRDISAMSSFQDRLGNVALIDVFEIRFPDRGELASVVDFVHDEFDGALAHPITTFFEVSLLGEWRERLETAADAVSAASHQIDQNRWAGLKIRCGGLDATAIPSVEAVAGAIIAARDVDLPLKATQGLHHPFRHLDASLGATVHGFLNLFAAAIHARAHQLDVQTVREILADEDPASFALTESGLRWRDLSSPVESIDQGRETGMTSFGSCSFSEPRDDLADLGLL